MLLGGVDISLVARLMHRPSLGCELAVAHRLLVAPGCSASFSSSKPVFDGFSLFGAASPLSRLSP